MSEKRRHPRKSVRLTLGFQVGNGPRVEAESRDMSLGGMFVMTNTPAPFGASITVYLPLPGLKQEAVVKSTVRWTEPDGMGVQFGLMGARETHALTQMLLAAPPAIDDGKGPRSF